MELPDFEVRILRSDTDLEDAPMFVLREEEIDLYLQWLARDHLTESEVAQLRRVYQSTIEGQAHAQGVTSLLPGMLWYAPMQKKEAPEENVDIAPLERNTPYATEQALRTQEKRNVFEAGTNVTWLEKAAEVLYDLEGEKRARFAKGDPIQPEGIYVPGTGPAKGIQVEETATRLVPALTGKYQRGRVFPLDAEPSAKDLARAVYHKKLELPDLDVEIYRALQKIAEADAEEEAAGMGEDVPKETAFSLPTYQEILPLAHWNEFQEWKDSKRFDLQTSMYKPLTLSRPLHDIGQQEELRVTAGDLVDSYDILRSEATDPIANLDLSPLSREVFTFFQAMVQSLQMEMPASEELKTILEFGTRDIEYDAIFEKLCERLPTLQAAEVDALLRNPRLALQREMRSMIEDAALARKQALRQAILQTFAYWSANTSLRLLEKDGNRVFGNGPQSWSYGGFPFRKKERGLLDRVAELLHGTNKLPIPSESAAYLAKDMREVYQVQFADHFLKRQEIIEKKMKAEKARASEQLKNALIELVTLHREKKPRETAHALVRVLHMMPSLLQLEKLQTVREIQSDWYAYGDFAQSNVKILQQIYAIMKDLSKIMAPVAPGAAATGTGQVFVPDGSAKPLRIHAGVAKVPIADDLLDTPMRNFCEDQFKVEFGSTSPFFSVWSRLEWHNALRVLRLVPQYVSRDLVDPMVALLDQIEIQGDIFDVSAELRWKLGVLLIEMVRMIPDIKDRAVIGKKLLTKLETMVEIDRDVAQINIAKLREKMKKNMLDYLDHLTDEDKAAVRELSKLGLNAYKDVDTDLDAIEQWREEPEHENEERAGGEGGDYEEFMNREFDEN